MSKNYVRRYYKFNIVLLLAAYLGLGTQVAHGGSGSLLAANTPSPSGDDSGFDSLVTSLRNNPVNVQELLAKPKAAPANQQPQLQQHQATARSASRAPSDTNAVTPYTDSFFTSKVSPY